MLSVRGKRYEVVEGKTAEVTVVDAPRLLAAINTETVVGLRERLHTRLRAEGRFWEIT